MIALITGIGKVMLEFLKLAPRYFVMFGAISAFLLFASRQLLELLSVAQFVENYRSILAIIFIASVSLLSITLFCDAIDLIKKWRRKRNYYRHITDRLNCLTEDEKQILRFYIAKDTRANILRVDDGIVKGLETVGIIYRSATIGNLTEGFAYNITDFAWNYLHKYHWLLEGSTDTYRTDKLPY